MPDTKLTWSNLREHLRRNAAVYLVLIVAAAVLTNLLWTTTTPRTPEANRVLIYLADIYSNTAPLKALEEELLAREQAVDPTLEEVSFESLTFADPEENYTGPMVLMARLIAGEGDLFLASENAMEALIDSQACLPLDEYLADGWMADTGLEPRYADIKDPETGKTTRILAGLRVDSLTALWDMQAFRNEGACLCVAANSTNLETSMQVAEAMVKALAKESKSHD